MAQKTWNGKSKRTALFLSFFFGIFGADRFYLGDTRLGFYKLITLGGYGVWAIIDFIKIARDEMPLNTFLPPYAPAFKPEYSNAYSNRDAVKDFCDGFGIKKLPTNSNERLSKFFQVTSIKQESIARQEILKKLKAELGIFNENLSEHLEEVSVKLWGIGRFGIEPKAEEVIPYYIFMEAYKKEMYTAYIAKLDAIAEAYSRYYAIAAEEFNSIAPREMFIKETIHRIRAENPS